MLLNGNERDRHWLRLKEFENTIAWIFQRKEKTKLRRVYKPTNISIQAFEYKFVSTNLEKQTIRRVSVNKTSIQ